MTAATWNATGLFVVTASDSVICKVAPGAEEFAALLASAPDLLAERDRLKAANAELAAALEALDEAYCSDHSDRESRVAGRKALIATRAALAKHKGRTT